MMDWLFSRCGDLANSTGISAVTNGKAILEYVSWLFTSGYNITGIDGGGSEVLNIYWLIVWVMMVGLSISLVLHLHGGVDDVMAFLFCAVEFCLAASVLAIVYATQEKRRRGLNQGQQPEHVKYPKSLGHVVFVLSIAIATDVVCNLVVKVLGDLEKEHLAIHSADLGFKMFLMLSLTSLPYFAMDQ